MVLLFVDKKEVRSSCSLGFLNLYLNTDALCYSLMKSVALSRPSSIDEQISVAAYCAFELEELINGSCKPLPLWREEIINWGCVQLWARITVLRSCSRVYGVSFIQEAFMRNLSQSLGRCFSSFMRLSPQRVTVVFIHRRASCIGD